MAPASRNKQTVARVFEAFRAGDLAEGHRGGPRRGPPSPIGRDPCVPGRPGKMDRASLAASKATVRSRDEG